MHTAFTVLYITSSQGELQTPIIYHQMLHNIY